MDAARVGAPFCAVLGANLSFMQAAKIKNYFQKVLIAEDNDVAGMSLSKSAFNFLESVGKIEMFNYPLIYKDLGEIKDSNVILELKNKYSLA